MIASAAPRPMPPDHTAYRSRPSPRSRIAALLLAGGIGALVILLLILSGIIPVIEVPMASGSLSTFDVRGARSDSAATQRPRPAARAAARPSREPARQPRPRPLPTPAVPLPVPTIPGFIELSREDYARSDIGGIRGEATAAAPGGSGSGNSVAAYGPGAGPGGKTLYAAEWVREPTRQELAFYMPPGLTEGWATIICRTVPRNRVEDCRVLDEAPGSRIGQGLRRAAWQFLVLPPRIDGRPMVGSWVRIRYDIVRGITR